MSDRWGIYCTMPNATAVWLEQIAGDGRLLFGRGRSRWWGKPPAGSLWTAYKADHGQTYETREEALAG